MSSVSTSSVSTSSVSSASESSSSSGDVCTCGYCTWYKIGGAGSWTKGDPAGGQSDFCTSGCACADDPPTGTTKNCDGYKTEPYGIDTYICYKCCTASSSSQSSASSASSASSGCQCGCPVMRGADITGKMTNITGPGTCPNADSAEFDLKYRPFPPPTIPAGWVLGDWWRGSVTSCGGGWGFVVFCVVGENDCTQLHARVESSPSCVTMTNGHDVQSPISSTGTDCTCSPLVVSLGAFAGTSDGTSGCCCPGCDPLGASACEFTFTLYLTE